MENEKLVPKLRFSGFTDEWNEVTLNDVATFSKGKGISKNDISDYGIECVRYGELYTKYNEMIYNIESKTNLDKNELKLSEKDDILIPCSGETAIDLATASCIQKDQVAIGGDITVIKTDQYAPFITYYLNQKKTEIAKYAQGVSIVHLYPKDFKVMNIKIPSITEQKKIIALLEEISKKERLLESKYQEYQDFKKFLMQQIFAQKLRFDFENDWEKFTLGDIGETYNGLSGLSKDNFEKGNSRYITYKSIFDNNVLIDDLTEPVDLNNKSQNNVEKGDLFFTGSSETPEEVGMVSVLNFDIDNCYLNSFCFGYRLKDLTKVNPIFLAYYLRSPIMRNKIQILAQGSTRFNLSKKEILKLKINVPEMKEQIKILDLMQNNDKLLKNTSCQITEMNLFKKSLLQQMFVLLRIFLLISVRKSVASNTF